MTHNVLVTGTGAIIGYGIINSLRQSGLPLRIIAIDIYNTAYGQFVADSFHQGVLANSEGFVECINSIVDEEKVDLIIPGIEQDLYALHRSRASVNAKVVMNSDLCIELSKSKLATFEYLRSHSKINLIPTLHDASYDDCVDALGSPFLLKPISSYASKGIEIVKSKEAFDLYVRNLDGNCILQKIVGTKDDEYTIAVFGDGQGKFFDSIILKRYLSREGATSIAKVVQHDGIMNWVKKLVAVLTPIGPTNIQVRIEGDTIYLLEINPRISSACSIRTAFGYNEPAMCIKYYLTNEAIAPAEKRSGTAMRFISDHIIYE